MTNQEAIETIEANYPPENYSMLREALDMALTLLKEQALITRCRDCKLHRENNCEVLIGVYDPDWFCADGKRE